MATKQLTAAQKLLLEAASRGPLVYEALDGYGRRVAGILEDDGLLKTVGENVEITDRGRARLKARRKHGAPAETPKPSPKAATNGTPKPNGKHAPMGTAPKPGTPAWYADARTYILARHAEDLATLDRLAGIRA